MLRIALGLFACAWGLIGWGGQLLSALNPGLAERWGLQESSQHVTPLFKRLELHAARWDSVVLWTQIAAGILLIIHHPLATPVSILAGGITLDTGGREYAKYSALQREGIPVGARSDVVKAYLAYSLLILLGMGLIAYGCLTA